MAEGRISGAEDDCIGKGESMVERADKERVRKEERDKKSRVSSHWSLIEKERRNTERRRRDVLGVNRKPRQDHSLMAVLLHLW